MAALMDLVAGDAREILLVLSVDDTAAFGDRSRFDAHLPLGAGLDPTWLDLFCEAARAVRNSDEPPNFLDARHELEGPQAQVEYTVEYVDAGWIAGVARLPDRDLDAITGRWIDLLEEDMGVLSAEEKPWIRLLASEVVRFCRAAGVRTRCSSPGRCERVTDPARSSSDTNRARARRTSVRVTAATRLQSA